MSLVAYEDLTHQMLEPTGHCLEELEDILANVVAALGSSEWSSHYFCSLET